jgi:hypothetical protein
VPAPLLLLLDEPLLDELLLDDEVELPAPLDELLLDDEVELLLLVVPPTQVPAWQAPVVWQGVPSGARGSSHAPLAGLQVPARWHSSVAGQVRGPPQVPSAGAPSAMAQVSQGLSQGVSQQTEPAQT